MHGCHSHPHGGDSKDRQEAPAPTVLPDVLSGLRTFLQQDQRSFLPFFHLQSPQQLGCTRGCALQGQQIVGRNSHFTTSSTKFYLVASQPLVSLPPPSQLPMAKCRSYFSAQLLCLSAGRQVDTSVSCFGEGIPSWIFSGEAHPK